MWDSSVKRRKVTHSQTAQSTATLHDDMNIHKLYDLLYLNYRNVNNYSYGVI